MKYTVNDAAKIVGKTRQTIYRHIEKKPISIQKDDDGNTFIEASELLRVYGDKINFDAVNNQSDTSKSDKVLHTVTPDNHTAEIKVIEEKLKSSDKQIEMLQTQMRRERDMLEDQMATLKTALEKSQEVQNKTVALLENQSSENSGVGTIKKALDTLEERIAKQEQTALEEAEAQKALVLAEKERAESALLAKQDYQKTTKLLYVVSGGMAFILVAVAALYNQDVLLALLNR